MCNTYNTHHQRHWPSFVRTLYTNSVTTNILNDLLCTTVFCYLMSQCLFCLFSKQRDYWKIKHTITPCLSVDIYNTRCFNILANLNDVKLRSQFLLCIGIFNTIYKIYVGFISVSVWNNAITNNKLNFDDPILMHILYYI